MFKLTKLEQTGPSMVEQGRFQTGDLHLLWTDDDIGICGHDEYEQLCVQVDSQVLVTRGLNDYIKTSPVQEILKKDETSITFRTRTSIYKLEELLDAEEEKPETSLEGN